jgi:hypothetical protein
MSVTLLSPPDEVSFSADFINAKFACADYLQQQGTFAVNTIDTSLLVSANTEYVFKYGARSITFTSFEYLIKTGFNFPTGNENAPYLAETLLPYFDANYYLNADFVITASGYTLTFTARTKGLNFDFKGYGVNTVAGLPDIVKPNYSILVKLMCQNATDAGYSEIYSANLSLINGTSEAIAIFGDKLHQRITSDINKLGPEIPSNNALLCNVSCRKYYFVFGESYGQIPENKFIQKSPVYTVLHGGFSYQAKGRKSVLSILRPGKVDSDRFLKQGSKTHTVLPDQPKYLYFFNTRPTTNAKVAILRYLSDKTNTQSLLYPISLIQNTKYCFDVSPSLVAAANVLRYEAFLVNDAGEQISEKQTYTIERGYIQFARYFLNWSSFGAMDCRMFHGKGSSALDLSSQKAVRNIKKGDPISRGSTFIFGSKAVTTFKARTGYLKSSSEMMGNKDFFVSDLKFRSISGQLLPIALTSGKIDVTDDNNNLFAQEFEYQYLFEDDAYSESDVFDKKPGLPAPPVFISTYNTINSGTAASPSTDIIQQTL